MSKSTGYVALLFAILYFVFFRQLPLKGMLPGDTDTLLAISFSNLFSETFRLALSGKSSLTVLYPAMGPFGFGENCHGISLLFDFFEIFTRDEVWAYYLMTALFFTLNSLGVFKIATLYTKNIFSAVLAGLVFGLSAFALGNLDDINVVFIFFPALGIYYLLRSLKDKSASDFRTALILSAVQIWFGFYIFFFQILTLVVFGLFNHKKWKVFLETRDLVLGLGFYLLISLPLLGWYFHAKFYGDVVDAFGSGHVFKTTSLRWSDFKNVLPGNLIYSNNHNVAFDEVYDSPWCRTRRTCYPGMLYLVLSLFGIVQMCRRSFLLPTLYVLFFLSSLGAHIPGFESFLALTRIGLFFRVPLRAYYFATIFGAIFFGMGLDWFIDRVGEKLPSGWTKRLDLDVLYVLVAVVFILENVPFPLPGYRFQRWLTPPVGYSKFFLKDPAVRSQVLDLPSVYYPPFGSGVPMHPLAREGVYMNWQTYHHQIIWGGVNGYLPRSRVDLQARISKLPESSVIARFKAEGLNYIVYHKNLVLEGERDILPGLKVERQLRLVYEDAVVAIFSLT